MSSTVTVRYSHAAPYLREQFVQQVRSAHNSRTQKDRASHFKGAWAFYQALSILAHSADTAEDYAAAVGLPDSLNWDKRDAEQVRAFLGASEYQTFAEDAGLPADNS